MTPPKSLLHALEPFLETSPDKEALVFGDHRISFGEMAGHAAALADTLRSLGVQKGDRVAALFPPRPEAILSMLACWLIGATWMGVNPRYQRSEQAQILSDAGVKVLMSMTRLGKRDLEADLASHEADLGLTVLRFAPAFAPEALPVKLSYDKALRRWREATETLEPDSPSVVIYTSGSTGKPKGALITHAGLAFRSYTLHTDRFNLPEPTQLIDLPVNHIGALASGIGVALASGGKMILTEQFDPGVTLRMAAEEKLAIISGVPAMLARLVEHPEFAKSDLSSVRAISWGAGPINEIVLRKLMDATDAVFSQQYGMTESNGPIVFTPPTRDIAILLNTTGTPDPRLEVRIADDSGQPLPDGEEGEVQIRHPHPFAGYLGNAEASEAAFTADGFLHTGDLAKIREDGYLVFCGRSKEMYKSGGFNVYPREIEIALEAHPAIRAAAVLGVNDEQWGQVGHAFVELASELTADDITSWCKARLADFKVPKRVSVIDAMPRTPVDKVDRMQLAEIAARG
ncbi:MAG: AMP-binding protein [Alphaproteobacteria bacterium]|nr:AMP-binding protein [Alphaproteobacteria bacterium]